MVLSEYVRKSRKSPINKVKVRKLERRLPNLGKTEQFFLDFPTFLAGHVLFKIMHRKRGALGICRKIEEKSHKQGES